MPTQFFSNADDNYVVKSGSDYYLTFLGGNDILSTTGGTNINAAMGEGDDLVRILAGTGTYAVYGESGNDRFELYSGGTVDGGAGSDEINIRGGTNFSITGGSGDDQLTFFVDTTGVTADLGDGNDTINGNGYSVSGDVYGGAGNDFFIDLAGATLHGGTGDDIYRIGASGTPTIMENAGEGLDSVQISGGISYTLTDNVENLVAAGYAGTTTAFATLTGNALDNSIYGWNGDERINGLGGDDQLYGRGGNDQLNGGGGNDLLDGGSGDDVLQGQGGNDTLYGRAGADTLIGGTGNDIYYIDGSDTIVENVGEGTDTVRTTVDYMLGDNIENAQVVGSAGLTLTGNALDNTLLGGTGDDTLYGGGGNDTIKGGAGDDTIWAMGSGNNTLIGNEGNDIIHGANGNDTIDGGAGNDSLYGSLGTDTFTGGDGNDTFYFLDISDSTPAAPDHITDFNPNGSGTGDVIDLTAIDANTAIDGDQAFTFSGYTAAANSAWVSSEVDNPDGTFDVTWSADVNGDSVADFAFTMHQLQSLSPGTDILF